MTVTIVRTHQETVGSLTNLIGELEGRVDRVQIASGGVVAVTDDCTSDCTGSCVTCDTCFSCDSCTCSCIGCGDPPTSNPTPPTTTTTTTTFQTFDSGGWD